TVGPIPLRMADITTFGGTPSDSGIYVDKNTALQIDTVSCCVRVIAETFGSLSLHVYERTKDGRRRADDHPAYRLLHDNPNEDMTSSVWREVCSTNLSLSGNSYSFLEKVGSQIQNIRPLKPEKVKPYRQNGYLRYKITGDGGSLDVDPSKILHVP